MRKVNPPAPDTWFGARCASLAIPDPGYGRMGWPKIMSGLKSLLETGEPLVVDTKEVLPAYRAVTTGLVRETRIWVVHSTPYSSHNAV